MSDTRFARRVRQRQGVCARVAWRDVARHKALSYCHLRCLPGTPPSSGVPGTDVPVVRSSTLTRNDAKTAVDNNPQDRWQADFAGIERGTHATESIVIAFRMRAVPAPCRLDDGAQVAVVRLPAQFLASLVRCRDQCRRIAGTSWPLAHRHLLPAHLL